ncbi:MAG: hypothetical protein WCD00_15025 [Desulfuromonadaceae bacterium]
MKKIIALTIMGLLAAGTSVFATDGVGTVDGTYSLGDANGSWTVTATNVGENVTFVTKLSANVMAAYSADTTAAPLGGQFYAIGTGHTSGNKTYASASSVSRLFMKEMTTAGTPEAIPTVASDMSDSWTGWTSVK